MRHHGAMAVRALDGSADAEVFITRRRKRAGRDGRHPVRLAVLATFVPLLVVAPLRQNANWSPNTLAGPLGARIAAKPGSPAALDASKKGVCVWSFRGVTTALSESGATWYLTWSTSRQGIVDPRGVQFVPMVRTAANVTPSALAQAERSGPALLTFNEPDLGSQADMTVAQALSVWPRLMATKLQLASPAVATGAATPRGWLDRFMRAAEGHHYRVNFIAVHWYGADFQTAAAVAQLKSYLDSVHRRYELPVWVTEYALINFAPGGPIYATSAQQAAFVTASVRMLDSLSFVKRYAWFALPAPISGPSSGLYAPGPRATPPGLAFARA